MANDQRSYRPVITGTHGMVSTGHSLASVEAVSVLKTGGNAVDAALAAAGVLSVVKSYHCGLGGDVFALCYCAKEQKLYSLNGSGRSPYQLNPDLYEKGIPSHGIHAATVPGAVDAWKQMEIKFATRGLAELWKPAIEYAKAGFAVFPHLARVTGAKAKRTDNDPSWSNAFLCDGKPPVVNELFVQKNLWRTLKEICENGSEVFYNGWIAEAICRTSEERNGFFTIRDFREHRSIWEVPIQCSYRGFDIYVPPPNSYGLLLLLQLKLLEKQDLSCLDRFDPKTIDMQLQASGQASIDGRLWIGDPEHLNRNDLEGFLHSYPQTNLHSSLGSHTSSSVDGDTTYIATADGQGNWVSLIQSVHQSFGCGIIADNTGIVLNNRMPGFNLIPGHPNELAPGKRPAHTLSPAMVFKNGLPLLALGTPGGMGQTQFLAQILSNLIDFDLDIQGAIEAPRWQNKANGTIEIEERFPDVIREFLKNSGTKVEVNDAWEFRMGGAEGILLNPDTGVFQAGADPRRDGYAIGY